MKSLVELINRNIAFGKRFDFFGKKKATKKPPVITISRETGSGGRPIASLVAKKLGRPWKVYHKEIVEKIAKETMLEKELISEIDDANIPSIDKLIFDFFGKGYPNLSNYYKHLVKIISTIGNRGHVIIIGRGADFLLSHALKVRIICEMDQRINWLMEFEKMTRRQAIERINEFDRRRDQFIKTLYHHDPKKAHHYDLVIRTGKDLSIKDAAEIIVRLAKRRFLL